MRRGVFESLIVIVALAGLVVSAAACTTPTPPPIGPTPHPATASLLPCSGPNVQPSAQSAVQGVRKYHWYAQTPWGATYYGGSFLLHDYTCWKPVQSDLASFRQLLIVQINVYDEWWRYVGTTYYRGPGLGWTDICPTGVPA